KQNNLYTDEMTSRWDVQPLRLNAAQENSSLLSIFPNPCSDQTTIHFTSDLNDVYVYDLNGRLIASFKNVSGDLKLETQSWNAGIYFLKVESADKSQTGKFTKE